MAKWHTHSYGRFILFMTCLVWIDFILPIVLCHCHSLILHMELFVEAQVKGSDQGGYWI